MRFVQHKKEAYWFYRFLSIFYDKYVNPLFWTERMRDESLELAHLDDEGLTVIDVGSGTGFTTEGIVKHVKNENVECVDQSPHQMAKAKAKETLKGCGFQTGDAEQIPFDDDTFDRYVSAGSIEYWPNPQLGICESYRVIKPGGTALNIGPLEPKNAFGKWIANTWMLFPKDEEYIKWFEDAGFVDIEYKFVAPHWSTKERFGIAISGRKPEAGKSPIHDQVSETEDINEKKGILGWLHTIWRIIIGSTAGFLFIPAALYGYLRYAFHGQKDVPEEYREKLTGHQITAILIILGLIGLIVWLIIK